MEDSGRASQNLDCVFKQKVHLRETPLM